MGNPLRCIFPITAGKNTKTIRLVDSDGHERRLQEVEITANEIMKRYPENIVAQADSFYIGEKVPVLSEDEKLEAGRSYFLLPAKMKGNVLSVSWLASLAGKVSPVGTRFSSTIFEAEKSEDGNIQLKLLPEFVQKVLETSRSSQEVSRSSQKASRNMLEVSRSSLKVSKGSQSNNDDGDDDDCCCGLCSSPELLKDYQLLVRGRAHGWQPNLETIVEEHRGYSLFRLRRTK